MSISQPALRVRLPAPLIFYAIRLIIAYSIEVVKGYLEFQIKNDLPMTAGHFRENTQSPAKPCIQMVEPCLFRAVTYLRLYCSQRPYLVGTSQP